MHLQRVIYVLLRRYYLAIRINKKNNKFNISRYRKEGMEKEWMAYDVKARKKVKLVDPELVTLKNGRKALKGKSIETKNTLFRIISPKDAEEFSSK